MTELNDLSTPQAAASTVLDDRKHEETAAPANVLDAPEEKPGSARDAIAKAFDEVSGEEEEPNEETEAKAKPEKVEKADDGKPADKVEAKAAKPEAKDQPVEGEKGAAPEKDDAGTGQDGEKARQSEGRKYQEPPARFLPEARAKWANVPNEVKAEFHRVSQEFEQEVGQYKQSHEEWTKLSKFDQMAKQHQTSVSDALERYTAVDGLLHSNPIEGIRQVLATVGITPQQYAEYITKNPQAAQAPVSRAPDPVQQSSPEIAALREEIEALKRDKTTEQVVPIVHAFASKHDDYAALEPQIAKILASKVIEQLYGDGLSPEQKLSEAYRMAGGKGPSSRSALPEAPVAHSEPTPSPEPVVDPRGLKSIKGAPSGGFDPVQNGRAKSRRSAVETAMAEIGA